MLGDKVNVAILGGGLAGLSAGYHIKEGTHLILERSDWPGGLASSLVKDGFTFDHTGHLLHLHDEYGKKFIFDMLKDNIVECKRNAYIYSHKTMTQYPFQANTYGLPEKVVRDCLAGFLIAKQGTPRPFNPRASFRDWVLSNFGPGFANHFFTPYNQKIWTVPLDEMTCEWMGIFVPQPSQQEVLDGAASSKTSTLGYNSTFYYPKTGGIQSLVDAIIHTGKPQVHCGIKVTDVYFDKHELEGIKKNPDGSSVSFKLSYDKLINTIPLPYLIRMGRNVPDKIQRLAAKLRWTSVLNINIGLGAPNVGGDMHWVYFPESQFPFYRIGFPQNFTNATAPKGCSSVYFELAYTQENFKQCSDPEYVQGIALECITHLKREGIVPRNAVTKTMAAIPIPVAYVIYDKERTAVVEELQHYLSANGVSCAGRYGDWKYSFMEAAILDGRKAAEKITTSRVD